MSDIREEVRARYAEAATSVTEGNRDAEALQDCCGPDCCGGQTSTVFGPSLYTDTDVVPDAAKLASLGCGNPVAVADLNEGETVLDLGSGGGIDVLLSAKRVGTSGKAYGLDMTDEMLELARRNALEAQVSNVEFLKGYIEEIPLPDASVDVVISNCVINLSADKNKVFEEIARVLRPGGRIGVSDVVSANELTPEQRSQRGTYVGCIAGALSFDEYNEGLKEAGFEEISVAPTHEVTDGMFAAIIKARRSA